MGAYLFYESVWFCRQWQLFKELGSKYLTKWTTDWLIDRPTDWLTNQKNDWLFNILISWLTDWLTDWYGKGLIDLTTDWSLNRSNGRLSDWLNWMTDWLINRPTDWKLSNWLTTAKTEWMIKWPTIWLPDQLRALYIICIYLIHGVWFLAWFLASLGDGFL